LQRGQKKTHKITGHFFSSASCSLSSKETRLLHVKLNKRTEKAEKRAQKRQATKIMGFLKKNGSVKCYARRKWLADRFKQIRKGKEQKAK